MSQENVEVVRQVFEASARGDRDAVLALYDPDVEWDASRTQPGLGEFADVVHGHEGIREFFRRWREAWGRDEYRSEELIDAGDAVVSVVTQVGEGRASGVPITRLLAGVWTIRDGQIVKVVWFPTRDEALKAAGLTR